MPPLQHSQAVCGHEPSTLACSLIAVDVVHVAAEKHFKMLCMQLQNIHVDGSAHALPLSFCFDMPSVQDMSQRHVRSCKWNTHVTVWDRCMMF